MGDFREMTEISAILVVRNNFKLFEHGRAIHHFESRDLGFQIFICFAEYLNSEILLTIIYFAKS